MEDLTNRQKTGGVKNPQVRIIYFYICGDCNLSCRHCWIAPKFQNRTVSEEPLPFDIFTRIINEAAPLGLQSVKLTGGEPLIHPDIVRIITFIRDHQLALTIETNGILITKEIAHLIKTCNKPFVSVSIDGMKETHEWVRGVKGSFDAVCTGTKILVDAGVSPQVIMTIMEKNHNQIREVVRLAEEIGASSVKFNFIQPTERGQLMHEHGETLNIKNLIDIGTWIEKELQKESNLKLITSLPMAFRPLSSMFGCEEAGTCGICGIHQIMGVLSDGTYALCGIGESVRELTFGNAKRDTLEEIWNNNPVLKDIREHVPRDLEGICQVCALKWRCIGSCVAQNYYRRQNLLAPFWFCEEADEQGLFPQGRKIQST